MNKLFEYMDKANNIVFFTGAGVSTPSGIGDFTGPNGLYKTNPEAEYMLSLECLENEPEKFEKFMAELIAPMREAEPNVIHKAINLLRQKDKNPQVITQNIDDLHERAGGGMYYRTIHLHGTISEWRCVDCNEIWLSTSTDIFQICGECSGIMRPNITLYGEALDSYEFDRAKDVWNAADLIIVCGTSLSVSPANNLVLFNTNFKAPIVYINNDPPAIKGVDFDHVIYGDLEYIFQKVMERYD